MKIETVFIKVKNINLSKNWYQNVLGLTVNWENKDKKVVAFNCGETDLTLVQEQNPIPYNDSTFNILVNDIENLHHQLSKKDILLSKIKQWNNIHYFELKDLDGNHLEFISKVI